MLTLLVFLLFYYVFYFFCKKKWLHHLDASSTIRVTLLIWWHITIYGNITSFFITLLRFFLFCKKKMTWLPVCQEHYNSGDITFFLSYFITFFFNDFHTWKPAALSAWQQWWRRQPGTAAGTAACVAAPKPPSPPDTIEGTARPAGQGRSWGPAPRRTGGGMKINKYFMFHFKKY